MNPYANREEGICSSEKWQGSGAFKMGQLYDRTDIYDLFDNEDKYQAIRKHWEKLLEGKGIHSFLDVSIGTGSLTLPMAELGVSLYGSDLSEEMLKRCVQKAEERKLSVRVRQSDFRQLSANFQETFDCVGSTVNSLPYVSNEDVMGVLEQMDALVKTGGYLYFDMRNWDKILRERNRFYLYNPVFLENARVNLIQVWDYHEDASMSFHLLYTFEQEGKIVQKEKFEEHYIPIRRELLLKKLGQLGYQDIQVCCHPAYFEDVDIEKADWYCVIAQKR